jgi:hypothetical protein
MDFIKLIIMKTKMKNVTAIVCGLFMVVVCGGAMLQSDQERINRKEVREFYDKLKTAPDFSVLDELLLPEGTTKEEFRAKLNAKRKALTLRRDSIKKYFTGDEEYFALSKEYLDAYMKDLKEKGVTIDSLRRFDPFGLGKDSIDLNSAAKKQWEKMEKKGGSKQRSDFLNDHMDKQKERMAKRKDLMAKRKDLMAKREEEMTKRKEEMAKWNKEWLKQHKHLKKYLKINEKGLLKLKERVNYDEIINNPDLSVRERKEAIVFLYFIERDFKGKLGNEDLVDVIASANDDLIDAIASALGYSGSSIVDQSVRETIELTQTLLKDGKSADEIRKALDDWADKFRYPMLADIMHKFINSDFDAMLILVQKAG